MIASEKCENVEAIDESSSLSPSSFFLLFVLSGGVSTIAFTLYIISTHKSCLQQNAIWRLMLAVIKRWRNHRSVFSRRVSDVPQTVPNNFPNATTLQIQVQKTVLYFHAIGKSKEKEGAVYGSVCFRWNCDQKKT